MSLADTKKLCRTLLITACCGAALNGQALADPYRERARDLVDQMTLEEKAALASGQDFWTTKPIERLGIPSIWLADGPHGLRKAPTSEAAGVGTSLPATSFPTASALASSWDTALIGEVGRVLGREAQAQGVHVLLGPGANIKRSPLGGRNFEYFSEDPVLSGAMASAFINGVQSEGVGTSLKHYAVNNQETARMYIDVQVGERALREIYLAGFEEAVKTSQPWTIMASYNRVSGTYVSEHQRLLYDILKAEWGYEGLVVSDWGAVTNRVPGLAAGMHLEMPGTGGYGDSLIIAAVRDGTLDEARLDEVTTDTLRVILMASEQAKGPGSFDQDAHHAFARKVAGESIVLLRNEGNALPLQEARDRRVAVIGGFAKAPRYQGAGSSQVVPTRIDTPWDELTRMASGTEFSYADGYTQDGATSQALIADAVAKARGADTAIVFVGLPVAMDAEGRDRPDITLPEGHDALVAAVAQAADRVVVVLINGSAVAMPWAQDVDAILEAFLPGQAGGGAVADILLGTVNPSGKLSETFPVRVSDTPSYYSFPGDYRTVSYGEGIFVGYRHYDASAIEPLFPFGHGLSYTTFRYGDLSVTPQAIGENDPVTVSFTVTNTGSRAGREVAQIYVRDREASVLRPVRELKDFTKVALEPGESTRITLELERRDFAFFHEGAGRWVVEPGAFDIEVGASSRDIRLTGSVSVTEAEVPRLRYDRLSPIIDVLQTPQGREAMAPVIMAAFGVTPEEMLSDEPDNPIVLYLAHVPIIKLVNWSQGQVSAEMIDALVAQLNGVGAVIEER